MSQRQKSKNVLSPQRQEYDQFDSMDPPGKPDPEEPGAVALEHSQCSQKSSLRTWESFDSSSGGQVEGGHKKEKKGKLDKFKKGFKKRFYGSDHGNKKDESNAEEKVEQLESAHDEPQEVLKLQGKSQLSSDDRDLQRGAKGDSRSDSSNLSKQPHDFQSFKDIECKASQLEVEKAKLSKEVERLKNEASLKLDELTKKEDELQRFKDQVSSFEADNKALNKHLAACESNLRKTQKELTKTTGLLDQVKDDVRIKETKLELIQNECDDFRKTKHELSQEMEAMKVHQKNMEEKLQNKEAELKQVEVELKSRTEEAFLISKNKNDIFSKFHDALAREKVLEKKKMELEKSVLTLKNELEQMTKLGEVVQKQSQEHEALQITAKQWETELNQTKSRLEDERNVLTEVKLLLGEKKAELQEMEDRYTKHKVESESLRIQTQQLEIQLEMLKQENQNWPQKLEQEQAKWSVKHEEEMQVVVESNEDLKQQLREIVAKYETLKQTPPYVAMKIGGIIPMSEQNPIEFAQDLQLKPNDTRLSGHRMKRQQSVELLSEGSIQAKPSMSLHSSAPSSLTKESMEDRKTHQEVAVSNSKCEEEEHAQPYESPHTSLTEVVHRVTVAEDNMTDAVKINIQHEVALLQQKVNQLREENEKFQSELEVMKIERNNLNKIKEKYFSLVSERAAIYQKVTETDPQNSTGDVQKVVHGNCDAEESLSELNIYQAKKGISIGRDLQGKAADNDAFEGQSQPGYGHSKSKDKLDQMTPWMEEHAELKEVAETYKVELTSMKKELTRVENEHSDMTMEKDGLHREIARLEEKNLQLEGKAAKFKMESEFWQQNYENEGTMSKTAVETAELTMNLLQIEIEELKQKMSRKENEVQTVNDCRRKLEDQLLIIKQERDRQHDQITHLLAIKTSLKQELSRYDAYAQDLGAFKEQSQQFQKTLSMKIAEVDHLKKEKAALQDEIESMGEEIKTRKLEVSFIKKDFDEERKDRERMASEADNLKAKWKIEVEKLKDLLDDNEGEKQQKEYLQVQFKNARETWKLQRKNFEKEINALTNQVEELRTKTEDQSLAIDQINKEYDAKLKVMESRVLKEKQQHEQTQKELNRVTEIHQSSKQDFATKLANASVVNEQLEDNIAVISADKASVQEELERLQEEMRTKLSKHESERITSEKNLSEVCKYNEQLQETVSTLQREKVALLEETKKLTSMQVEAQKHHEKERQDLLNRLKAVNSVRKAMKTQYDEEKLRADEAAENYSRLSRDLRTKDQAIIQREQNVQILLEQLQSLKCKAEDLEEVNLKLKWENKQLLSKTVQSDEPTENYRRLYQEKLEIEQQRVIYEKKYDTLLDDYRELRLFAQQNGLQVPQRKAEDPHQFSHLPGQSKPFEVRPFVHEARQRHHRTDFVSGHGPAYPAYSEQPMQRSQFPAAEPGTHSPSAARVGHGSRDPSNVNHLRDTIQENELIQNIDDDIVEAAADMEERVVDTSLMPEDDARPLDSNLICPLCGKQFRIGQIQHYRYHVDNCTNK